MDIDPDLAEVAYARVKAAGLQDRIEIRWGNALDVDMSDSTVVFLFMGEGFNKVIRPLLWRQLKVGARVVSNDFAMGDWTPDRTVEVATPGRSYRLYLWTITEAVKKEAEKSVRRMVIPIKPSKLGTPCIIRVVFKRMMSAVGRLARFSPFGAAELAG